jgi:hypothetical protein
MKPLAAAILWFASPTALHAAETPAKKPNLLLRIADELGRNLGGYGVNTARPPPIPKLHPVGCVWPALTAGERSARPAAILCSRA